MALIKCTECNKEISDKASACPGCGAPVSKPEEGVDTTAPQETTTESPTEAPAKAAPPKTKAGSSGMLLLAIPAVLLMAGAVAIAILPKSEKKAKEYVVPTTVFNQSPQAFSEVWNKVVVREEVRMGKKLGLSTSEFEKFWQIDVDLKNPKRDSASFRAGIYRTSFWDLWFEATFEDGKLTALGLTCEFGTSCTQGADARSRLLFAAGLIVQVTSPEYSLDQADALLKELNWVTANHLWDIGHGVKVKQEAGGAYATCLIKIDGFDRYVFEAGRFTKDFNHCSRYIKPL